LPSWAKEAGPFFTYGEDSGYPTVKAHQQERYEAEYLNTDLAFTERLVVPVKPEQLRARLVEDVPRLYVEYEAYWQALMQEFALG
jgi:hypothetical protein